MLLLKHYAVKPILSVTIRHNSVWTFLWQEFCSTNRLEWNAHRRRFTQVSDTFSNAGTWRFASSGIL